MHPLIRRVRAGNGRPEGNHIHARVFAAQDAAFQAGMNGLDFRFFAFEALIYLFADVQQFGLHIGLPAGVAVALGDFGAGQPERRRHAGGDIIFGAFHRAALVGADDDRFVVADDGGQVSGGFHEVFDVGAHLDHAVWQGQQGMAKKIR